MTTYLNVPFRDKAEAKAKGARWDSEARKWFVPIGRELKPFTSWLPVDPSKLASQELAEPGKGVPLSQLLAGVATAVEQAFRQGVWTTAEVVRVDGDTHVYLELAERDAAGTLIAKARAIVWGRDVERVLGTFQTATGVRLVGGKAVPLQVVQNNLGHASIGTTSGYPDDGARRPVGGDERVRRQSRQQAIRQVEAK